MVHLRVTLVWSGNVTDGSIRVALLAFTDALRFGSGFRVWLFWGVGVYAVGSFGGFRGLGFSVFFSGSPPLGPPAESPSCVPTSGLSGGPRVAREGAWEEAWEVAWGGRGTGEERRRRRGRGRERGELGGGGRRERGGVEPWRGEGKGRGGE